MTTALEVQLQNYAHNLVVDNIRLVEYDGQINLWKQHINNLADAQAGALNRVQGVLTSAQQRIAREREAAFGLSMLALSLVAGPALSWIAGQIQYKWFPKFTSTVKVRTEKVMIEGPATANMKMLTTTTLDHNKVWAKVFGDVGKQAAGWGIDKALHIAAPSSGAAVNAVHAAVSAPEETFKTKLENALLEQSRRTSNAIMSVAMAINADDDYGEECLERLKRVYPRARDPNVTEKELKHLAKQMIHEDLNARRQEWARDWFYFGYNPGSTNGVSETIEREMWAMWILNEEFKPWVENAHTSGRERVDYTKKGVEGATFGKYGLPKEVLNRLGYFGVIEPQNTAQFLVAEADRNTPDDAKEHPRTKIGASVDTLDELDALTTWAKNHPMKLGAGQLNHTRRELPSVENIDHSNRTD